jgi:hypothetical protein
MEAVAWTAIGLLAVAVADWFRAFFYLRSRIDAFGQRLDASIDAFGADPRARLDDHPRRPAG